MADKDILSDALEEFDLCAEADAHNRESFINDIRFGRLGEQWDDADSKKRQSQSRPCLTVNLCNSFARQVVNEARQNKISIKVRPVDDNADIETAEVMNGLIRNIEHASNADAAYDTAAESAVDGGFGYFRIAVEYAHDDSFDKDLRIQAIQNPLSVYADPHSTESDSSDWNTAFVTEWKPRKLFLSEFPGASDVDWSGGDGDKHQSWADDDSIQLAEWWKREQVTRKILKLSNNMIVGEEEYKANKELWDGLGITVTGQRDTKSYKVTQRLMTGSEILETTEWAGCYIPIVPVYGDVINLEGKRYLRSLIHDAKGAQRQVNYFESTAAEMVALAPKAPYVGPESAFSGEHSDRWETANTEAHPFLSHPDGVAAPVRQPYAGTPIGAVNEALRARDNMKAIMGIYDAGLGNRSNETSGKAIAARQRESDTGTFHFVDNLARAVRHAGRILIDMIPSVYTGERIIRVLGNDDSVQNVKLGPQGQQEAATGPTDEAASGPQEYKPGSPLAGVYDLGAGKYDLAVDVGPAYATQRQEAADQMMQLLQSFPDAAPIIGDLVAKNLDWPGADEIAERLKSLLPPQINDGIPPAIMQKLKEYEAQLTQLMAENQNLKASQDVENRKLDTENRKIDVDEMKIEGEAMQAKAEAIKALNEAQSADAVMAAAQQLMAAAQAISAVPGSLNAEMMALRQEIARPRKKIGRAQKQPDGSFLAEVMEG
jgi:hypothetical protein